MVTDKTMRFFEWDYDNLVVIEYERLGECNGCGDCCIALIPFTIAGQPKEVAESWEGAGSGGAATTGTGVWNEVRVGATRRFFRVGEIDASTRQRCPHLTENNQCAIHLTKPLFHKAWPLSPRHVTALERCSYSFREVGRWPLQKPTSAEHISAEGA
jgi:Fe-S-cluster containining protein